MATVVTLIFDDLGSEPFYDQKCLFVYKIMYYLKCQWYLACKITVELRMSRQFKTSCSGDFNEKKKTSLKIICSTMRQSELILKTCDIE